MEHKTRATANHPGAHRKNAESSLYETVERLRDVVFFFLQRNYEDSHQRHFGRFQDLSYCAPVRCLGCELDVKWLYESYTQARRSRGEPRSDLRRMVKRHLLAAVIRLR